MIKQDLVVIGGGTGGFIVAIGALRAGLRVSIIEKHAKLGGLSLHAGCVPSKTLLHIAHLASNIVQAKQYGLDSYLLPPDLGAVNAHINKVVQELADHETNELQNIFNQLGGTIAYGQPKFLDSHTITVNQQPITAKKFVIATGSRPLFPAIKGLDAVGYITNEDLFQQQKLWSSLIILGGRPSAIEFAQAFSRLGTKVTLVISGDSILNQEDPELVCKLKETLVQGGIDIFVNTTVREAYMQKDQKLIDCVHDSGESFVLAAEQILVALGRCPNVEGLGLENANIAYNSDGIIVDNKMQTSQRNIFALGDVIDSPYKLTHIAEHQAHILLNNLLFRYPTKIKYQGFPYVIFTDPEYAHVGLTETQAKALNYKKIDVMRFEFKHLDSAIIRDCPQGLIKVITSKGRVIGASILGAHASNLIAEWGLAIKLKAKLSDVAATIHAYPTMAQINRRVANKPVKASLFMRKYRWFAS